MPATSAPDVIRKQIERVWEAVGPDSSAADLIIVVDEDIPLDDFDRVLFTWGACADPGRDQIQDARTNARRRAFDATSKNPRSPGDEAPVRKYAPYLIMDETVQTRVMSRWAEYGLDPDGSGGLT